MVIIVAAVRLISRAFAAIHHGGHLRRNVLINERRNWTILSGNTMGSSESTKRLTVERPEEGEAAGIVTVSCTLIKKKLNFYRCSAPCSGAISDHYATETFLSLTKRGK